MAVEELKNRVTAPAAAPMLRWDFTAGYTVLRVALGVNIAVHGLARLLPGPGRFVSQLTKQFSTTFLPAPAVSAFGYGLPWIEGALGVLILLGALTRPALLAGALLIAVLSFGSCLIQDWNAAGFQLIYATVYALLLASCRYNAISIDRWLGRGDRW